MSELLTYCLDKLQPHKLTPSGGCRRCGYSASALPLLAEVRRLHADLVALRAERDRAVVAVALESETGAAAWHALEVWIDCGGAGECALDAPDGEVCRKHAIARMDSALDRTGAISVETHGHTLWCAKRDGAWVCHRACAVGRADRYAEALAHIESLAVHARGCREVGPECDCGVCPDRHGDYAHGPDCAQGDRTKRTMACVPECPTATAKRAREGT